MACQFIHRGFLVFWLTFSLGVLVVPSGKLESENINESLQNSVIEDEITESTDLLVKSKIEEKSVDSVNENSIPICLFNPKILHLVKPTYPKEAKDAGVSGKVSVQITIDENGNVISAKVVSGHPELSKGTEAAALQTKFKPTTFSGNAVKVRGIIVYNFEAEQKK